MRVVLVHGAGGSRFSWSQVAPLITAAEPDAPPHELIVVDHFSQSHETTVANVRAILDQSPADALLVGHSYGGAVITDAGRHQRVRGLVYVAAFAPDEGETIDDIVERYGPAEVFEDTQLGSTDELLMPGAGDDDWARHSWDVPEGIRMAAAQQKRPISTTIFQTPAGVPAWRTRPTWYLVAAQDKHIRPETQRIMAQRARAITAEVDSSHSVPYSSPVRVAAFIDSALSALPE